MAPEEAIVFGDPADPQMGVLHPAKQGARCGVLIVVGGPQYRVGAHRSFVLWARALAAAGIPVFRFDLPGMGDSAGEPAGFDHNDSAIQAALSQFFQVQPNMREVVLLGLCDAASAAMIVAPTDPRVSGLVLLNPWVRSEAGQARTLVKHYYLRRVVSWQFWRKLLSGATGLAAGREFLANWRTARSATGSTGQGFVERMHRGWSAFGGESLLILSGQDLTAQEFVEHCQGEPAWARLVARNTVQRRDLPAADHTFSRAEWRNQVAAWVVEWLAHD